MKDLINRRINNIQSLEDRKLFRDVIGQIFGDVVDYQDRQIESLRKDFFEEMTLGQTRPIISGTIINQHEYDVTDNFMFPMFVDDTKKMLPSAEDITKAHKENKPYMIGKTLLKCDHKTLDKLYMSNRRFNGIIYTNTGTIDIKVRLVEYKTYKEIVSHLYSVFVKNGLEWTTPNLPYIYKFAAFMLDETFEIADDIQIDRIEVDLEEFEPYRKDDVLPVWNLEYKYVQSINFPIATYDNVLKEHKFDVYDIPSYCYIPDFINEYEGYVKRQKESVSVIIPESNISEWPMYKLHLCEEGKNYVYENEIYSNGLSLSFGNGYLNQGRRGIRTKGEMMRILSSFKASEMFRIYDCEIIEGKCQLEESTYHINEGIIDSIRSSNNVNTLVIYYDSKYENNYLTSDIMSFLVSELQQYIPDMKCVGVVRNGAE